MLHLQLNSKVMVMKRDERTWQFRVGWVGGWLGWGYMGWVFSDHKDHYLDRVWFVCSDH
jgi:hypothetical protein